MSLYDGIRLRSKVYVRKDGRFLCAEKSRKVLSLWPGELTWGEYSLAAKQLALVLLLEETTPAVAIQWYDLFTHVHVATWAVDHFVCTGEGIRRWLTTVMAFQSNQFVRVPPAERTGRED
jgi:uncharacterized protein DUF6166